MCSECQREQAMCGTMKGNLLWHQQEREKDQAEITRLRASLTAAEAERDAARSACRAALSHMAVAHPNGHQDLKDILRAALKEKP